MKRVGEMWAPYIPQVYKEPGGHITRLMPCLNMMFKKNFASGQSVSTNVN